VACVKPRFGVRQFGKSKKASQTSFECEITVMSENAITVENLSKHYLIGHRLSSLGGRYEYSTLRDVIGREISNFARKAADVVRGRQIVQGDEVEEFWALRDVSFEVKQGEVLGIIGRNGAGKSTLLKILSRITEPTEGRAILRGRVGSLLEVGTGFHPELTGRENIFLNGAVLGMTQQEIRQKFDEIVDFAEVEKFLDTPVKYFSSGMYIRLAFAVAAHLEPEILVVDEVLAVGDAEFQKKCLGKMEGVVTEGRTILFVSHQMSAVNQLCRHVVWLDKGKVIDYGETNTILSKYLSMGLSHAPFVKFKEPKNTDGLFFSGVSILDKERNPTSELDARFPFYICLHYEVSKALADVEMAIRIKRTDGTSVFTTAYSDYSDVKRMNKVPGSFVATVQIPALFLMPGSYTISAYAFRLAGLVVDSLQAIDDVIRFTISETGTKMAKYNDHKNIGVVLVNFPWKDEVSSKMGELTTP
jgi:lipopolysaccharide transport system ATP-binding protein